MSKAKSFDSVRLQRDIRDSIVKANKNKALLEIATNAKKDAKSQKKHLWVWFDHLDTLLKDLK